MNVLIVPCSIRPGGLSPRPLQRVAIACVIPTYHGSLPGVAKNALDVIGSATLSGEPGPRQFGQGVRTT